MLRLSMMMVLLAVGLTDMAEARTLNVRPGPAAQTELQAALINARPGDTVRLARGRYELSAGLSLDVAQVTIRGAGMDRTILSFRNQTSGAEGLLVTSDQVTLRDFAVEDTRGDGIKSRGADQIAYRNVRVEWTRGPHAENGAYGVYPVNSRDVLLDGVVVKGASDAGIYVGQSNNIVVRSSLVEFNVAGIEIENSMGADVFENVARNNTAGIMVFDLPGVPQHGGHSTRVFRNEVVGNNTPNFAAPGNIVGQVPGGTGLILMASRNMHIFENRISDHGTANVIVTAFPNEIADPEYNPLPREVVIRDNEFGRSGHAPQGRMRELTAAGVALPDILWDGSTAYVAGGRARTEPVRISVADNRKDQRNTPVTTLSLNLPSASSPYSEAQPAPFAPAELVIPEPRPIRLPHG